MTLHNVDASYKVFKYNKFLVIESEHTCIVFYGSDIKKLKRLLKAFK